MKNCQENEKELIEEFWDREILKCEFVLKQREQKKEDYTAIKLEEEKKKALAEAAKDVSEEQLEAKELEEEE